MDTEALRAPHDRRLRCVPPPLSSHKTREFVHARNVDHVRLVQHVRSLLTLHGTHLHQDLVRKTRRRGKVPSAVGAANDIISSGRISGTPPTRVETTCKPAHAASRIAIPNASVSEVFRKIEPCRRTCIQVSVKVRTDRTQKTAYGRHVPVRNGAEQGDSILQEVHFPHLKEIDHFGPVSAWCSAIERDHMKVRETHR